MSDLDATVGFIGLGVMGQPMALNLARSGAPLVVWNRTSARALPLRDAGAAVADTVDEVFARAEVVVMMLIDDTVTDWVLGRGTADFSDRVSGRHLIVSTDSVSPAYSRALAADIRAAGGRFVESPVSGSRGPAEAGTLVALLGGDPADLARAEKVVGPMTTETVWCGPRRQLTQLVDGDFETRAASSDAHASTLLIAEAARSAGIASPLLDLAGDLYGETVAGGAGRRDMIAVIEAIAARTEAIGTADVR